MITLIFNRLFDLSLGEQGGFELLAREHELNSRQHDLLELNRELAVLLVDEVDGLVEAAEFSVSQEFDRFRAVDIARPSVPRRH